MKRAFVLLLATMLCACVEPPKRDAFSLLMDKWVGRSGDDLVSARGVPSEVYALDSGGRTYEYYKSTPGKAPSQKNYTDRSLIPDLSGLRRRQAIPKESICKLLFTISASNTIQSWTQEGEGCD